MTQRILGPTGSPTRRRRLGLLPVGAVMALVALALLAIGGPGAARIQSAAAASGIDPTHVSFTIEGCRNNGGITLPNGDGDFVCPDAAYTPGNLGKGWNELDLVPFRTTTDLGLQSGGTTTYDVRFTLDLSTVVIGYDLISAPVVNTALSDAGAPSSYGGQQGMAPPRFIGS